MDDMARLVLWAMAYLLVKHAVADFYLQTPYQYCNKGIYGHPGGFLHAGIHIALTLPVYLILPPASFIVGALILAGEFVVHYHVDWAKEQVMKRSGWTWRWRFTAASARTWALTALPVSLKRICSSTRWDYFCKSPI